jgi:nucleoid DNA-binding protein
MAKAKTKKRTKATGRKTSKKKSGASAAGRSRKRTAQASGNGRVTGNRLTGKDIEAYIAGLIGVKPDVAHELWRQIIAQVRDALVSGRAVNITNIGTLEPYEKAGTTYRHPTTGELTTTEDRQHVRFIVSTGLKADLNRARKKAGKKKSKKKAKKRKS